MAIQSGNGRVGRFGRDGDEPAAGSLWIEEKVAVFLRNAFGETHAIANEIAVILQAAGEEAFARGFHGSGKIRDSRMIDLERHGFDSTRRIAEGHFPRMAQP